MRTFARIALIGLMLCFIVQPAHAAGTLAPLGVLTDPVGDGALGIDALVPGTGDSFADLVGAYIGETDTSLTFVWQVEDIPDPFTNGYPLLGAYYWDFSIDNGVEKQSWELTVNSGNTPTQASKGTLSNNCTLTGTLWSCSTLGAKITVAVDPVANTISASVLRKDLKGADKKTIATDGATLQQEAFFGGVSAVFNTPGVIFSAFQDDGQMDDVYILGAR